MFDELGSDWLAEQVDAMPDHIERVTPVLFNEQNRYLPQGVSPRPGFIRYDLFPFLREVIECFDPHSPVREVNFMKGVQTGYTTLLESIMLYYIAHIKTQAMMFLTADKELAAGRMENNIIPMINESGFADLIRSADEGNSRKTGKNKDFVQWDGGGFMIYNGAMNAAKMRQYSVPVMLKDELDGWKRSIGKDGNSDALTDARMSAYWAVRKILRGSTPLLEPSMINDAYLRGDQRKYMVLCKSCAFPQEIKQAHAPSTDTGVVGGFQWDTVEGVLQLDSVRYACANCGHEHYEHDKERLFSEEHGAHWQPTAKPKEPGIRSYHLPAFYSPYGFRPWSKCVADYLEAYDPVNKQTKSVSKLQEYYNNTLGVPFRVQGSRIQFQSVSAHRRPCYMLGEIPNRYALDVSGSPVLMLVCVVDVHKDNLAVSVMGATRDARMYVVDYWRFEVPPGEPECNDLSSPVWQRLRDLIEEKEYTADDGKSYRVALTLVDAGWSNDTVTSFCAEYTAGVYPILGRDRPGKNQTIREFSPFETQQGTTGYKIVVDHYKDRLSPVLRRDWTEDDGPQRPHHFNAPQNMTDKQLKELTVEVRREKVDAKGGSSFEWHRPGNARNELWDLLCYAHAAVEITAWSVCIKEFGLDTVDWSEFWRYIENEKIYFNDEVTT